ncbi:MAG: dihydropteroate synthase [Candidatus Omnitrophica bacterium]|nr:dihydropteroate synthase [Candidatus Omnitrophota bacterium]
MLFKARRYRIDFSKKNKVLIVGILNITPDSFSEGKRYFKKNAAYRRALEIEAEGAAIIDIGAESTRPGSAGISASEELKRIIPVLDKVVRKIKIPISIDTTKSDVAYECLRRGAAIINDISGLTKDPAMASVVKKFKAGLVIMHMRGEPATMQKYTAYKDCVREVIKELRGRMQIARSAGVAFDHIIVDPGIGFSKTVKQNLEIIRNIKKFHVLKRPLLIGPSRKSFIGKVLNRTVNERLAGTLASVAGAVDGGAEMIRVHDVRETNDFLTMRKTINEAKSCGTCLPVGRRSDRNF